MQLFIDTLMNTYCSFTDSCIFTLSALVTTETSSMHCTSKKKPKMILTWNTFSFNERSAFYVKLLRPQFLQNISKTTGSKNKLWDLFIPTEVNELKKKSDTR